MGNRGGPQLQTVLPMTPMVKKLVIANVAVWMVLQVIVEQFFLKIPYVTSYFSLSPMMVIEHFFVWQPFTYMFLHAANSPWHILFNMLMLWWLGAELEMRWGGRFFLLYYFVCGVGAAILYVFF